MFSIGTVVPDGYTLWDTSTSIPAQSDIFFLQQSTVLGNSITNAGGYVDLTLTNSAFKYTDSDTYLNLNCRYRNQAMGINWVAIGTGQLFYTSGLEIIWRETSYFEGLELVNDLNWIYDGEYTVTNTNIYFKPPATQPATHEMTITLGEGVESLEMNFTEPDLPKVTLRVYTYGDVSAGDYGITVSENDNVIFEESGTFDAIDTTLEVTQNSTITVEASGGLWYFTIYRDGISVTSAGMDGQTYSFTITDDTTISVYCNYD